MSCGESGYGQCRCHTLGLYTIQVAHLHMAVPHWGAGHNQSYPNCICPCTPTAEGLGYNPYMACTHGRYLPSACSECTHLQCPAHLSVTCTTQNPCEGPPFPSRPNFMCDILPSLAISIVIESHTLPCPCTSVTQELGLRGLPTHRHFPPSEGGVLSLSVAFRKLRKVTCRFAKWQPPSHKHASSLRPLYWVYTYCRVDTPKINAV